MSVDLYKKYAVNKEDVKAWAEKNYPAFLSAESVMVQLYLNEVRGVLVEPTDVQVVTGEATEVADLEEGTWCVIEVAVGRKIRETQYMGCPICYKSISKDGPQECGTHGAVESVAHSWARYIAGDNSGEIVVSTPPRFSKQYKDLMGSIIKARGVLNDQGEFNLNTINIIGGKTQETLVVEARAGAPAVLKEKAGEFVNEAEVGKFQQMLEALPSMALEDLEKWHSYNKIATPLNLLIMKAGAEEFEEDGKRKYRAPRPE